VLHDVVAHTVPRRAAVAVLSESPSPKPPIVSWLAPLVGPLEPLKLVATGPSYENAADRVPTAPVIVSPSDIPAPEPAPTLQETEVDVSHMELRQRLAPIVMVAVVSCTPKFVPSSASGEPPDTATLNTDDAVMTGPS
jgi:hypothetical protein